VLQYMLTAPGFWVWGFRTSMIAETVAAVIFVHGLSAPQDLISLS
jgi:hypothetical protein